jgi:hypothetical protein
MNKQQLEQYKKELLKEAIEKELDSTFQWSAKYFSQWLPITKKNVHEYLVEEWLTFSLELRNMHIAFTALKELSKEHKDIDYDFDEQAKKLRVLKQVAEDKVFQYFNDRKDKLPKERKEIVIKQFGDYYKSIPTIFN